MDTIEQEIQKRKDATAVIQRYGRGFITRLNISLKFYIVGPGIVSYIFKGKKLSALLGDEAESLDREKQHEIMITKIDPKVVTLELVTNQGDSDHFMKYLAQEQCNYGAIINGGFYAINSFYNLPADTPIGLHRFPTANYIPAGRYKNRIVKNGFDNTNNFFEQDSEALSRKNSQYHPSIETCLNLKTQLPNEVKDEYGLFKIGNDGSIDILRYSELTNNSFSQFQSDAKYLLSSGPVLVWDSQQVFDTTKLEDPRFQFITIKSVADDHPGTIPPGTFYHADQRNPRSGIGTTLSGNLVMITVKGDERPSQRDGLDLAEFGFLSKLLKTVFFLNCDGGHSAYHGIHNEKMYTPKLIKSAIETRTIPCSIIATEKQAPNKRKWNRAESTPQSPERKAPRRRLNLESLQ